MQRNTRTHMHSRKDFKLKRKTSLKRPHDASAQYLLNRKETNHRRNGQQQQQTSSPFHMAKPSACTRIHQTGPSNATPFNNRKHFFVDLLREEKSLLTLHAQHQAERGRNFCMQVASSNQSKETNKSELSSASNATQPHAQQVLTQRR